MSGTTPGELYCNINNAAVFTTPTIVPTHGTTINSYLVRTSYSSRFYHSLLSVLRTRVTYVLEGATDALLSEEGD